MNFKSSRRQTIGDRQTAPFVAPQNSYARTSKKKAEYRNLPVSRIAYVSGTDSGLINTVSNGRNQPFSVEPIHMGYATPPRITSQADDNLVPICGRARNDPYGSKRRLVFHAWSRSTSSEARCSGSPQSLTALSPQVENDPPSECKELFVQ
jgi:hypothetical protein